MRTKITAHSGADATPDNSLAYVRHILETAADALEVDVRRAGGRLVLGHDAAGPVGLSEVMELVAAHPSMRLDCDLKEPDLEEDIAALADACGLRGRIIFSGIVDPERYGNSPTLRETAEVHLNIEDHVPDLYLSYRDIPDFELEAADRIASLCGRCGIHTINIYQRLVTRRLIETLSARGIGISAWTVDDPQELRWCFQRGVASVTTRRLTDALSLRERMERTDG